MTKYSFVIDASLLSHMKELFPEIKASFLLNSGILENSLLYNNA